MRLATHAIDMPLTSSKPSQMNARVDLPLLFAGRKRREDRWSEVVALTVSSEARWLKCQLTM